MKTCIKCNEPKPESDFYRARKVCKPCVIAHQVALRRQNPEKSRASMRKYKAAHREQIQEMNARYYAKNRDAIREKGRPYDKRYYAKNKDRIREYLRAYRARMKLLSSSLRNSLPVAHAVA